MKKLILLLIVLLISNCPAGLFFKDRIDVNSIKLPPGFKIDIYAKEISGARSMAVSQAGIIFVGSRDQGKVYAVIDKDKNYIADKIRIIDSGLRQPNGVAIRNGSLYVAEISRILRYDDIENNLTKPQRVIVYDKFPDDEHHGWKYIAFGPDDKLYVPVGMPCNICEPEEKIYGTITRINPNGSGFEIFAKGIRNTVGFDWHPETKELWFTENGRDWLGDDVPPDELCKAPKPDMHFGFPYCNGSTLDPEFGKGRSCDEFTKPEIELGPHVAALGMKFYTANMFPPGYHGNIFIAEHGSWNRSDPIGYRVMMVTIKNGKAQDYKVFASGWLKGKKAWGRPVDILILDDGSMLVSDDKADAIYRIYYKQ